ncbi:nuclease-related domain-containing DEAD/DEAH box helicase [Agrobacterium rubi]|uniref:DNA 3'-5' helicase II n=1 Tax=Agrobacterium rubi TaxID=28099 RepID=A0AAE7R999_9HYPH|nr:NERD domain-containing protein/DEAD/DEAH box helicase [Agrobacterium rubi]NTE86105.1 AAA family ATPase [Agrobacterium rubi]NTF02036.1 AAA family ATPase [Agrobacterium rubi]NTF36280.1 AAA family ATPase [Agrobacterium rubi]OCJ54560.1 nuclease [Agrobacterium rubi]QTG01357.1 AAA family ATPase [Agrobacterium rubi]
MVTYIGIGSDLPEENSERLVAKALKKIGDDWTVIHHVVWQSKRAGRQGDGEADFVLLHPNKGILILEVKGGGIDIHDGRWTTTDRYGRKSDISPFEQVEDSKYALIQWLKAARLHRKTRVGHAVVFPDIATLQHLGPAATPAITWFKSDLDNIAQAIQRAVDHWSLSADFDEEQYQEVVRILAPTVTARKPLATFSSEIEQEILFLTAEQVQIFGRLRAARGGVVIGGAGSGKTVLAIARAEQLAKDGFRTLFVCFNELLGNSLQERFAQHSKISASSYHSICLREIRRAKLQIPERFTADWWEHQASSSFKQAVAATGLSFDAIVIDECQDFRPEWVDSLRSLVPQAENAPMFFFADQRQELWKRDWETSQPWAFSWTLYENMRNTLPIATKVRSIFQDSPTRKGINGPDPRWIEPKDSSRPVSDTIAAVEELLKEGFAPKRIVVLCTTRRLVDRLREHSVGSTSFGTWGGHGIAVETIRRFKGLEGEAIVVVLDTSEAFGQIEPYIAFSRARTVLTVIGTAQQRTALNW